MAVAFRAEGAKLSQIDKHMAGTARAQNIRDPVGDVALGDAVQREAHARSEGNAPARHRDAPEAGLRERRLDGGGGRPGARRGAVPEMRGIEFP